MGQKVNPVGMRIGLNKNWNSRWFANDKEFSTYLIEDNKIRNYLEKTISKDALLSHVEIERKKKVMIKMLHIKLHYLSSLEELVLS